jgi:hypothetical protein
VKKKAVFLLILICAAAVFSQNSEAPKKEKIAVYVTGSVDADEKKALGTKILVELINSGRYRAVERSDDFVRELDREQSKQQSGAVDDNQITSIGKQFGVQIICVADLTPAFGSYLISARLIDVESAEIMAIADVSNALGTMDDLTAASKEVVRVILGGKSKKRLFKPNAKAGRDAGAPSRTRTVESGKSIGVRGAFGNAMNFDAQFTTITKTNRRVDLMMGYCGFKYEYMGGANSYPYRDTLVSKSVSAFEFVHAGGRSIGNAYDSPVSGYISVAYAVHLGGESTFDIGLGGQAGVEYNWDDFIIGIDFRPMYYCLSAIISGIDGRSGATGFRYTIGMSVRYGL